MKETGNKIHNEIRKSIVDFKHAATAQYYPNNTFRVGGGDFFVKTTSNNYIFPKDKVHNSFQYNLGRMPINDVFKSGAEKPNKEYMEYPQDRIEKIKESFTKMKVDPALVEDLIKNPMLPDAHFTKSTNPKMLNFLFEQMPSRQPQMAAGRGGRAGSRHPSKRGFYTNIMNPQQIRRQGRAMDL